MGKERKEPEIKAAGGRILHGRAPEAAAFLLYAATLALVSAWHEPWFDEAQSWQIARCAGVADILFTIPHYEGHPQLWHMLLVPFAKSGIPFELGLKLVGFLIAGACAFLILFKSPFPRPLRLLLPFNYFFFYQYGVMVRPYMLLLLFLLLLAMAFPDRHRRPARFVGLLVLLCLTHAYGMVIAAGVALAYTAEIVEEKGLRALGAELVRDTRTRCLLALLCVALAIVFCILPREDTYNPGLDPVTSLAMRLLYTNLGMLSDCLLTTSSWFSDDRALIQLDPMTGLGLMSACASGLVILACVLAFSSRKSIRYFALPYLCFAAFGGIVYLAAHHVGVALEILVFWLWVAFEDEDRLEGWAVAKRVLKPTVREARLLKAVGCCVVAACLVVPIYWTVFSCIREYQEDYGFGRGFAAYLRDSGLDDTIIFNSWVTAEDEDVQENTYMFGDISSILAYFDTNIIANADTGYLRYQSADEATNRANIGRWEHIGIPDVLIGNVALEEVFGPEVTLDYYTLVYDLKGDHVWKGRDNYTHVPIYVRNDVFERRGLQPLDVSGAELLQLTGELKMTGEMAESIRSGDKTADEILDEMGF